MAIKQYLDVTGLTRYDSNIKSWVNTHIPVKEITAVEKTSSDPVISHDAAYQAATGVAVGGITYYTRSGSGTTEDPYVYTAASPQPSVGASVTSPTQYYISATTTWNINLAAYAKKSDIVNVFKFKGVKQDYNDLPSSGNTQGDIWHVVKKDSQTVNAEYVWVDDYYFASTDTSVVSGKTYYTRSGSEGSYVYTEVENPSGDPSTQGYYEKTAAHWEALGSIFDPSGSYATKDYVDNKVSTSIAALNATVRGNLTSEDAVTTGHNVGVKVIESEGKLTSVTVVESDIASASLLGTVDDTSAQATAFGKIKAEAAARESADEALLKQSGTAGSYTYTGLVTTYVSDKLNATAVGGTAGDYLTSISESAGIITATKDAAISAEGDIKSGETKLVQAQAIAAAISTAKSAAIESAKVMYYESGASTSEVQVTGLQPIATSSIDSLFSA